MKQLSPDAHSSPFGKGKLFAQSLVFSAGSSHEIPQKFVHIIGALGEDEVNGAQQVLRMELKLAAEWALKMERKSIYIS